MSINYFVYNSKNKILFILMIICLSLLNIPSIANAKFNVYDMLYALATKMPEVVANDGIESDYEQGYKHYGILSVGYDHGFKAKVALIVDLDDYGKVSIEGKDGWVTVYYGVELGFLTYSYPPVYSISVIREKSPNFTGIPRDPKDALVNFKTTNGQIAGWGLHSFTINSDTNPENFELGSNDAFSFGAEISFVASTMLPFLVYEVDRSYFENALNIYNFFPDPVTWPVLAIYSTGHVALTAIKSFIDISGNINSGITVRDYTSNDDGTHDIRVDVTIDNMVGIDPYPNVKLNSASTNNYHKLLTVNNLGFDSTNYLTVAIDRSNSYIPDGWTVNSQEPSNQHQHYCPDYDRFGVINAYDSVTAKWNIKPSTNGDFARIRFLAYTPLIFNYSCPEDLDFVIIEDYKDIIVINEESIVNHEISDVTFNDEIISFNQTVIIDSSESDNVIYAKGRSLPSNSNMTVYINGATKAFSGPVTSPGLGQISYGFKTSWLVPGLTYNISIVAEEFLKDDLGYDHLKYQTSFDFKLQIRQQNSISLHNPDIAQNYSIGQPLPIEWTASQSGDSIKIEISRNGGATWATIVDSTPNNGSYTWNVTGPTSSNCLIRVSSTVDPSINDISDAPFSIISYCSDHDLRTEEVLATPMSMTPNETSTISAKIYNKKSSAEVGVNVNLSVTGANYSGCNILQTINLPGYSIGNVNFVWPSGSCGLPSTSNQAYIATVTATSSAGCDENPIDDSSSASIFVSDSGDPPDVESYRFQTYSLKYYGDDRDENMFVIVGNRTFKLTSPLYNNRFQLSITGEGTEWYDHDFSFRSSDNQYIWWYVYHYYNSSGGYQELLFNIGQAFNSAKFDDYKKVVSSGDTAVFNSAITYDPYLVYRSTGDSSRGYTINFTRKPDGNFSSSGNSIRVGTSGMAPGKNRFAILTDDSTSIPASNYEYVTFGEFEVIEPYYILSINNNGSGSGQVRITIAGNSSIQSLPYTKSFPTGTNVQLEGIASSGSRFVNWSGDVNSTANPVSFSLSDNSTITANFNKTYNLSLSRTGDGNGSIQVNGAVVSLPYTATYDLGNTVSIQSFPSSDSVFNQWHGDLSGKINPNTITINQDRSVSAEFLRQYPLGLSINSSEMGKVFVNWSEVANGGSITLTSGESAYIYATAKPGYQFVEWSGDATGTAATTSVVMDRAKNVAATFSVAVNCNYIVTPSGLSSTYTSSGGEGTIQVNVADGCVWTAAESAEWISITAGSSGTGNGTVAYSVAENLSSDFREATISVAGKNFVIYQSPSIQQGDVDGSGTIDLSDAVKALQVASGTPIVGMLFSEADVNNDSRIGLAEAIYAMNNLGSINPVCSAVSLIYCTSKTECEERGGYWWSNNTCNGSPQDDPGTVTSVGRVWMDRNLGASRVATSMTDSAAYGDLYQWGRGTDGHEKRNSGTTSILSSSDNPGYADFILATDIPYDWRIPQNDDLWQGASGINNPCPAGFRLPTAAEWEIEQLSWSSNNSTGAYNSSLKLVPAGRRNDSNGTLNLAGSNGYYWTGSVFGNFSRNLYFNSADTSVGNSLRANGFSVRCIQDEEPEEVPTVESAGQVWMDRNLGASRVATSMTDEAAYGDLYQWGRGTDGHEKRTSGTTPTLSSSDTPGHSNFITVTDEPIDWRSPQNHNLWQGVSGSNNPCPAGFRLPSSTEWGIERASWGSNDTFGAFGSPLKLVTGGKRDHLGALHDAGIVGNYWSSTLSSSDESHSIYLFIYLGAGHGAWGRAMGYSVRCLQD